MVNAVKYMTVAEVADELRVNPATVYRLVSSNKLNYLRIGRVIRISRADIEAYRDVYQGGRWTAPADAPADA